jgi:3',5'-cyclic AMP phosphodiesterase CpdA
MKQQRRCLRILLVLIVNIAGISYGQDVESPLIYVTNDIHYYAKALHDRPVADRDGKNIELNDFLFEAFAWQTDNAETPRILLVNGDLSFNGERQSHIELAAIFSKLEQQGFKVFVIPGNHDINNPLARSYIGGKVAQVPPVSPELFANIYKNFGYNEAISRDPSSLGYVAEPVPGIRLLMLDSAKYNRNAELGVPETSGAINPATKNWIRAVTASANSSNAKIIAAMHHSLADHHSMLQNGFTVDNAPELRGFFAELGINLILTGHIHAQKISAAKTKSSAIYDIATGAFSVYPHRVGLLKTNKSGGKQNWHYKVYPIDVELWAKTKNLKDTRLTNFNSYSEKYFRSIAENMVTRLPKEEQNKIPLNQKEALSSLLGILNARFFAGEEYLNLNLQETPSYKLLQHLNIRFLSSYAKSILQDFPPGNKELTVETVSKF